MVELQPCRETILTDCRYREFMEIRIGKDNFEIAQRGHKSTISHLH